MFDESRDEYGERYAEVYKIEWYYYKQSIVKTLYDYIRNRLLPYAS